jgi:hypothetical protein
MTSPDGGTATSEAAPGGSPGLGERHAEPETRLRVLFFLHSLGYLRFFDAVLQELLDRGHHVHLLFERDDHDRNETAWLEAMERREGFTWSLTHTLQYDAWRHYAMRTRRANDALRFFSPPFRDSGYLFTRAEHRAPPWFRALAGRRFMRSARVRRALHGIFDAIEGAIPSSKDLERELAAHEPDVFVLCPHLMPGMRHSDYVKATRALGIRSVLCVASWDNLSSKQQIHELPDRVVVWNETQVGEAMELHGVPRERLLVTGAQSFDLWFSWKPRPREEFCARVGLDPARPYLLYVGGSLFPGALVESEWAQTWLEEVRRHPALRDVGVLFRPHPNRGPEWADTPLPSLENVSVWPPIHTEMPVDREARADFYDSIYHSAAVFGLNTSAMIEAAVVGRSVHTMFVDEFVHSQRGVFHFDYLLRVGGGLLRVADDFDELRTMLATAVGGGDAEAEERRRRFLAEFVRPHGIDRPATPIVADAIEAVAALGPAQPQGMPLRHWPLRLVLALYVRTKVLVRRVRFKARLIAQSRGWA